MLCGQVFIIVLLGDRSGRWVKGLGWGQTATVANQLKL